MAALLRRSSAVDSYNVALCVCVCLFAGSTRPASRGHVYIPRRASLIAALCTPCLYLPRIIFTCEGNTVNQPTTTKPNPNMSAKVTIAILDTLEVVIVV